jgi:Tol biopolymer transport system component
LVCGLVLLSIACLPSPARATDENVAALAQEVAGKGWIVYSARADNGTWDLHLSRPDGSASRNLSNTPEYEEAAPRFAPNGTRILFRRLPKGAEINHDMWGFQGELIISRPDGTGAVVYGAEGEYPWACWSGDGKQIVCLERKGIKVINLGTREVVRELPRSGIYQQLFASADGKWFCGTGNIQNASWNVVRMNAEDGAVNAVHIFQSCTPDWFPDSERIIFSSRPTQKSNNGYGWTQLWMANADGTGAKLIYGEEGSHIYGGQVSPDGQYVLFAKTIADGGGSEKEGGAMFVMRLSDAPTIGGESSELRSLHVNAKNGPILGIGAGWEPHWTFADVGVKE